MSAIEASELSADALRSALDTELIGKSVEVLPRVSSTNAYLAERDDVPEGHVAFAETQTAGRGQYGRQWDSPAGLGLWFSILLRPPISLEQSAVLTSWAAHAVTRCLAAEFSLLTSVKPPNDVMIQGRKLAGILVEMKARPRARHDAIVGIGLNVNQNENDFPSELRERAVSIAILRGAALSRSSLAISLLTELDRSYRAEILPGSEAASASTLRSHSR